MRVKVWFKSNEELKKWNNKVAVALILFIHMSTPIDIYFIYRSDMDLETIMTRAVL